MRKRRIWKALKLQAFVAVVAFMAIPASAKPPAGKGGGGNDGGGTVAPPRVGELYYWVDWDLWRVPADGSSAPELIGPDAQLMTTNREIAISNYTYGGEPWCVVVLPSQEKYLIANDDGTYREIEVREMYALQFYRDQNGTLQCTEPIQLTNSYGSGYWFEFRGLCWDKTGADGYLTYRASDISMRLTDQVANGMIVLDDTQPISELIVKVPLSAAEIAPGMQPVSGESFTTLFENGDYANGFVTDHNWASLDPSLQLVAGLAHTDSGSFLEFFDAPSATYLFDGPATVGGGAEWSFGGDRVAYEGHAGLESASVEPTASEPVGAPVLLVPLGKSNGTEVLYAVEPRFSPDGTYLMYRSREKAKGSSTNWLRIVSSTGEHDFAIDIDGKPVRWVTGAPAP